MVLPPANLGRIKQGPALHKKLPPQLAQLLQSPRPERLHAESRLTQRIRSSVHRGVAEIQPKTLRWVWRDRIPAGKLCLIVGDPDKGKSLITLDIAARITTGRPFPDGVPSEIGSVIILSAEDDPEDTIRRKSLFCHAYLSVHFSYC